MIKLIFFSFFALALTACSSPKDEDDDDSITIPDGAVEMQFFDKVITVQDVLFELGCNQFMMGNFAVTKEVGCTAVNTDTETEYDDNDKLNTTWTIKSPDGVIDITAIEADDKDDILKIGDTDNYCLRTPNLDDVYDVDGEVVIGTMTIVASEAFKKPSEVESDKVSFIAMTRQDICSAVH